MKRGYIRQLKICVLLAVLLGCMAEASAQNYRTRFRQGSEVRLSWGYAPIDFNYFAYMDDMYDMYFPGEGSIGEYLFHTRAYRGDVYRSGAVNLSYNYRFKKWFEMAGMLSYSGCYMNYFDKLTDEFVYSGNVHTISFMPYVRFVWLHKELVRMYSGVGFGLAVTIIQQEGGADTGVLPAFCLTPIGITVGRDLYALAELSIATTGTVSVGIGYKF